MELGKIHGNQLCGSRVCFVTATGHQVDSLDLMPEISDRNFWRVAELRCDLAIDLSFSLVSSFFAVTGRDKSCNPAPAAFSGTALITT
jgi:hypothetical protein